MSKTDKAYFTRKMFLKAVLPAPLAAIGLAIAEMGDAILVGHAIGMNGLAAIAFTSPLFLLANFFVFGLSMGGAIVYTNLMTTGKKEEAQKVFNFFFRLSILIGLTISTSCFVFEENLLMFLGVDPSDVIVYDMTKSYTFYVLLAIPLQILLVLLCNFLINDDAETFSTVVISSSGALNLILSALLLLIFDWGVEGCSFGFFLSYFLSLMVTIGFIIFRKEGELSFRGKSISWKESVKPLRLGFATSSEYIFDAVFTLIFIHLLVEIDGNEGVAIFNVIENLSILFIFIYELIGKTSQPLFSTFFAEKNFNELHRVFKYSLIYSLLIGTLATILVVLYPQILGFLFGLDDIENVAKFYYAARIFCIGTIFMGVCLLLQNYLQSKEDEGSAFLVVFMRRIGASIPLVYILVQFGFNAIWFAYPLSEVVTLIVLLFYKRRKDKQTKIDTSRIYSATFNDSIEDLTEQIAEIKTFAEKWGATKIKINTLRLALEETWRLVTENKQNSEESLLIQLTLAAHEDGTFQLNIRNNGKIIDLLKNHEDNTEFQLFDKGEYHQTELSTVLMQIAKKRAYQFLYRKSHDFSTLTITI